MSRFLPAKQQQGSFVQTIISPRPAASAQLASGQGGKTCFFSNIEFLLSAGYVNEPYRTQSARCPFRDKYCGNNDAVEWVFGLFSLGHLLPSRVSLVGSAYPLDTEHRGDLRTRLRMKYFILKREGEAARRQSVNSQATINSVLVMSSIDEHTSFQPARLSSYLPYNVVSCNRALMSVVGCHTAKRKKPLVKNVSGQGS
jgi:hypothetical protein